MHTCINLDGPIVLSMNCRVTFITHVWFLMHTSHVIYAILNASDSGEKQRILRESRFVRLRETIQEHRGGNLLLSGTVPLLYHGAIL